MKRSLAALMGVLACALIIRAEDAKPSGDLAATLEQLEIKLDHAAQRANQPTSGGTNVIGLRGSKQEPLSKQLYWKGKTGNRLVSTDEVKVFRDAIDQARAGKKAEAAAALKSFLDKYPKSALKPDAEETLNLLAPATAPAVPTKP
jgi:TolA-binding protein